MGSGISENLRKRHTVVNDISQNSLESLLKTNGQIDIFLHDGDHRFKTKLFEYETAYRYIKKGGVIMSDDTFDSAFDLFVSKHKIVGYSVKYGKNDFFFFIVHSQTLICHWYLPCIQYFKKNFMRLSSLSTDY